MNINSAPRIGINGFGRIGFCALRLCVQKGFPVVAINASRTAEQIGRLFLHDTVHRSFDGTVTWDGDDDLFVNGSHIKITHERDPKEIPWKELEVEFVIECTGQFLTTEKANAHLIAGAKKVIMSAPPKDNTPMFVMGVNEETYSPSMRIVSNASCTTNCLAPLAKIVNDSFGIESGLMTTVHAMTSKQNAIDGFNAKDRRIARSGDNIIPSTTGAAKAVGKVIPELKGKLTGISMRVPVLDGSVVDLSVNLKKAADYDSICSAIREASETTMKGIVSYITDPLVSCDFIGNICTCNFDADAGLAITPTFVKLIAWYDNEMAYTSQLLSLARYMYLLEQ